MKFRNVLVTAIFTFWLTLVIYLIPTTPDHEEKMIVQDRKVINLDDGEYIHFQISSLDDSEFSFLLLDKRDIPDIEDISREKLEMFDLFTRKCVRKIECAAQSYLNGGEYIVMYNENRFAAGHYLYNLRIDNTVLNMRIED